MPVPAVVIAASNLMPALCKQLADAGELITFSDSEPIQALQTILERRPEMIVLERLFAATPRGAALINRIKTDPQLAASQVRVMSHTGDYSRQIARPGGINQPSAGEAAAGGASAATESSAPAAGVAEATRPLDWHGTRRAPRHRVRAGVEIQLDGNPVSLVDLSTTGAQVTSSTILRPNQKVRVTSPIEDAPVRGRGTIAWAKFELPKPSAPPVYRAGVEFLDIDAKVIEDFTSRNRQ
jgi:hypothetical protein